MSPEAIKPDPTGDAVAEDRMRWKRCLLQGLMFVTAPLPYLQQVPGEIKTQG